MHKRNPTETILERGGFTAKACFPGFNLPGSDDHGLGPLAVIVESLLEPGTLIAMHEHLQDEIVSWVPRAVMRHRDSDGGQFLVDGGHLLVMNAGSGFSHEEGTLGTDPPLRMLQILVRPRAADLEPQVQFGPLPAPRTGEWRALFGPEGSRAPFHVRNSVSGYDIRLARGDAVDLPASVGHATFLYVFDGAVEVAGLVLVEGETVLVPEPVRCGLRARNDALLVAFVVDPASPACRVGSAGDGETVRAAAARTRAASGDAR